MGSSLALSCNIRSFVIELDYGYRYLLEVYSELSSICFLSWLCYYSMLALHEMVSLLFLELYQLLANLDTMSTLVRDTLVFCAEPPPSGWTDITLEQSYEYWSS